MPDAPANPQPSKEPVFEDALAELEQVVAQLEAGAKPLEESLALYEKGVAALKRCHTQLDKAEKRIRQLVKGSNGEAILREVDVATFQVQAAQPSDSSTRPGTKANSERQKKIKNGNQNVDSAPPSPENPETSVNQIAAAPSAPKGGEKKSDERLSPSKPDAGGSLFAGTQ